MVWIPCGLSGKARRGVRFRNASDPKAHTKNRSVRSDILPREPPRGKWTVLPAFPNYISFPRGSGILACVDFTVLCRKMMKYSDGHPRFWHSWGFLRI